MKSIVKFVIIPFFFLWITNVKIPIGGEEVFIQFLYIGFTSFFLLLIMIARHIGLRRSSLTAVVLLIFLLIPTIWYQISGMSDQIAFEHSGNFPSTVIIKLLLVFLVFVTFNELFYHKYVTIDFIFRVFLISIIFSIVRYIIEYEDVIRNLHVDLSRPESGWVGGWNTYPFLLSLACMILLGPLRLVQAVRYSLLILIIAVMLTTLSRGGILGLSVGLFLYWRSKISSGKRVEWARTLVKLGTVVVLVLGSAIAVGMLETLYDRYIVSFLETQYGGTDYLVSVSSGRTAFWLDAVSKITTAETYYQWFFGYGVGHYIYQTPRGPETDIGNLYFLFVYEYGVIVGVGLAVWMFKGYSALRWNCNLPWAQTMKAMFAIFLVSSFVENFLYTTQAGWLIGIGAAIVLDILRRDRRSRCQSATSGAGMPLLTDFGVRTA